MIITKTNLACLATGCGSKTYHEYALTNTAQTSKQREHLQALQGYGASSSGISRHAHACIYYPKELGGFSSGCGEIIFNPYEIAVR